eukprot:scaffold105851_cov31-Tisochrysis_lutea.AAC.4
MAMVSISVRGRCRARNTAGGPPATTVTGAQNAGAGAGQQTRTVSRLPDCARTAKGVRAQNAHGHRPPMRGSSPPPPLPAAPPSFLSTPPADGAAQGHAMARAPQEDLALSLLSAGSTPDASSQQPLHQLHVRMQY